VAEAVAAANGGQVLQRCSAEKTFTVLQGETIGLDLTSEAGMDQGFGWHNITVSDRSVLETVIAPTLIYRSERNGRPGRFFDYVAEELEEAKQPLVACCVTATTLRAEKRTGGRL
jgi:hypothetical protein